MIFASVITEKRENKSSICVSGLPTIGRLVVAKPISVKFSLISFVLIKCDDVWDNAI